MNFKYCNLIQKLKWKKISLHLTNVFEPFKENEKIKTVGPAMMCIKCIYDADTSITAPISEYDITQVGSDPATIDCFIFF